MHSYPPQRSSHPPQTWLAARHAQGKDYNSAHLPRRTRRRRTKTLNIRPLPSLRSRSVSRSQQRASKASQDRKAPLKVTKAKTGDAYDAARADRLLLNCQLTDLYLKLRGDSNKPRRKWIPARSKRDKVRLLGIYKVIRGNVADNAQRKSQEGEGASARAQCK